MANNCTICSCMNGNEIVCNTKPCFDDLNSSIPVCRKCEVAAKRPNSDPCCPQFSCGNFCTCYSKNHDLCISFFSAFVHSLFLVYAFLHSIVLSFIMLKYFALIVHKIQKRAYTRQQLYLKFQNVIRSFTTNFQFSRLQ